MVFTIEEFIREENGSYTTKTIAYKKDISFLQGFFEALGGLGSVEDKVLVLDDVYENTSMESELVFKLEYRGE